MNEKELLSQHSFFIFLKLMTKKWWLFLIIVVCFGLIGFLVAKWQKPQYESNLTFVIDQGNSNSRLSDALGLASEFGLNLGGGSSDIFAGDNILEIIKSRSIIEDVFLSTDTFNSTPYTLIEFYRKMMMKIDDKTPANRVHFPVGISKGSLNYLQDSILYTTYLDFVKNCLYADRPDKKLSIFAIKVKTGNEKFTKLFTDKLIHAADSFYIDISSKKEKQTLETLEQRVASMKGSLSESLTRKAASQDANLNPTFAESQVPLQKQQANIQVYGSAYTELFKNLELARFQYLNKIPLIQIIDNADYPMHKVQASKLKTALFFAFIACFITFLYFWLVRLFKEIP